MTAAETTEISTDSDHYCVASNHCDPGSFTPADRQLRRCFARYRTLAKALVCAWSCAALLGVSAINPAAAQASEELVSFRCALAIDAVLAELDAKADNLVIQQVLNQIDDNNGQLVCIPMSDDEIQVRMQSTDMHPNDNRLVFSLDARTYTVKKTFYGR